MTDIVWLLRHGERQDTENPNWHEEAERVHDPGLTDHGHRQAVAAGERLREERIEEVYASPFLRAVQTAAQVADALDGGFRLEPGLGEHLNPEWFDAYPETLDRETLADRYPRIDGDYSPLVEPTFPEGHDDAAARIGETAQRLLDFTSARRLLLVGHGATVGGVSAGLTGSTDRVDAPLCGLAKLVRDGDDWGIERAGDTAHLDE